MVVLRACNHSIGRLKGEWIVEERRAKKETARKQIGEKTPKEGKEEREKVSLNSGAARLPPKL